MVRSYHSFPITDFTTIRQKMLSWASQFNICCFLDNNQYNLPLHSHECLLGAGCHASPDYSTDRLASLNEFVGIHHDWIFGHLSYDLKNEIHGFTAIREGNIKFPDIFFFIPRYVIKLERDSIEIGVYTNDHRQVFEQILLQELPAANGTPVPNIQCRLTEDEYVSIIRSIQQHIVRGDCYEMNYCMEFYAESVDIDPVDVFDRLIRVSPNPFSSWYRHNDNYVLCASPERYIRKTGNTIISQPIKGTSPRNNSNSKLDQANKDDLFTSSKDRSENVMVVDLVRNDLARICKEGSVKVDELFGIYTFPQVHQMMSTISGVLQDDILVGDIFRYTFPMGSMTGAPKRRVMELIEKYEYAKRGLFSGTIGYISPERDMDFNVVIRSILYDASNRYLSFPVGSGITYYSEPHHEYQECLLKAEAMLAALKQR